jgi:hypothetical protein
MKMGKIFVFLRKEALKFLSKRKPVETKNVLENGTLCSLNRESTLVERERQSRGSHSPVPPTAIVSWSSVFHRKRWDIQT